MIDLIFVDTNILVYRRDLAAGSKQKQAEKWIRSLWKNKSGRLSVQVLNEFYTVVTHKLKPGLSHHEARDEVRDFMTWQPLPLTPGLIEEAWNIERSFNLSYWDSLIIAAAQATGCNTLLTEDLQDGQQIGAVRIVNPFKHEPDSLPRGG
ncbi:MAG: PIN domain-containing protein [Deltaproteobacteria bacterium]|nr:PIN domain-containing protein [Deltaproteobacteria bacterium]